MKSFTKRFLMIAIILGSSFVITASKPSHSFGDSPSGKSNDESVDTVTRVKLNEAYGKLPLSFEANRGQTDAKAKFLSRGSGYSLFLTPTEAVLALTKAKDQPAAVGKLGEGKGKADKMALKKASSTPATNVVRVQMLGANSKPRITGQEELPGKSNYFTGNDPKKWVTNIPQYAKVKYEAVYPGIDLVFYGNQRQLEYDWVVSPGADPKAITLVFEGADKLEVDAQGDLVLNLGSKGDEVLMRKPSVYQEVEGARRKIPTGYVIRGNRQVGVQVSAYDKSRSLIIDPILSYSTYLGGGGNEFGLGIAVDGSGNAYVAGNTNSNDFPTCPSSILVCDSAGAPLQPANGGGADVFVAKLNEAGSALVYSTYLGGSGDDFEYGIAVDGSGNAYVTGITGSVCPPIDLGQTCFPTTASPIQGTFGGGAFDSFVTKIDAAGSALIYSTYLGGSGNENGNAIAVDGSGNAYVTGLTVSSDFPTANPLQAELGGEAGYGDAFVAKLNAEGSGLVYSTYLGGSFQDDGNGIAVDVSGSAYVTGMTFSKDFPTASPLQSAPGSLGALTDAFVAKLNPEGSALTYSTYLGGGIDDFGLGIAVDGSGNAYVTGLTRSTNFPTCPSSLSVCGSTGAPLQPVNGGVSDAFVAKLNSAGSALVYSTYLGGSGDDHGDGVAVDGAGNAYVAGVTASTDFPTANAFQSAFGGGLFDGDAFVAKINPAGSGLAYSSYLGGSADEHSGGIAVDGSGNAYVTGYTDSTDFPTESPLQPANGGYYDAFVAKIGSSASQPDLIISSLSTPMAYIAPGQTLPLTNTVMNQGNASAGASTVRFSLSITPTGGEAAEFLLPTIRSVGPLAAGASSTATTKVSFPPETPFAAFYICAMANGDGTVNESDASNNLHCTTSRITVTSTILPDLVLSALSTPTTYVSPGKTFSISNTVTNQGNASAGSSAVAFHLSTNTTYGDGDDLVMTATRSIGSLGSGKNSAASTTLTVPASTQLGTYYICAKADSGGAVSESDETNNTLCTASTIQVTLSDLIMTAVTPNPPTVNQGGTLSVTDTVQNQGAVATPIGFRVGFYLHPSVGADVAITTTRVVGALGFGVSSTGTTNLTVPASTPPNAYYVCAKADSLAQVVETDETNNSLCSSAQVTVPPPDLILSSLSTGATTVAKGHSLSIAFMIQNQGGSKAGGFVTGFHLSTDANYGGGNDIPISQTLSLPSLGVGASFSKGTFSLVVPGTAIPGTDYYVCGMTDVNTTVAESAEGNNTNCTGTTITVTP